MADLYRESLTTAANNGEKDKYRASESENIRCAGYILNLVNKRYDGGHFPKDVAADSVKEFGKDRVEWVIANAVLCKGDWDARLSRENRDWAKTIGIPKNSEGRYYYEYSLESMHTGMVDILARQFRQFEAEQLASQTNESESEDEDEDYDMEM